MGSIDRTPQNQPRNIPGFNGGGEGCPRGQMGWGGGEGQGIGRGGGHFLRARVQLG